MFCNKCGMQLTEDAKFCNNCGTPVAQPAPQPVAQPAVQPEPQYAAQPAVQPEPQYAAQPAVQPEPQPVAQPAVQSEPQYAPQPTFVPPAAPTMGYQPQQNAYAPAGQPMQNMYAQQNFAQPQFDQPKPKKKSKKGLAIGISLTAILLVISTVIAFTLTPLKGMAVKTFGSSDDYMQYVEEKAFDSYTNDASSVYGDFLSAINDLDKSVSSAAKAQVKYNVGEDTIALLEQLLKSESGQDIDLDWLNTMTIDIDTNFKNKLAQIGMALNIDSQLIADVDFIYDYSEMEAFVGILNLSSKYIKLPFGPQMEVESPSYGTAVSPAVGSTILAEKLEELEENIPELMEQLPSEKEMNKFLSKYMAIVTDNIKEVSKTTELVEIGDISEKLTVLEIEIDTDTVVAILIQILETAKDDKDLEKYINKVAEFLDKEGYIDDADDIYDNFRDAIDDALDSAEDAEDIKNEKLFTLIDYVNSKHEIVGREIKVSRGVSVSYLTVHKGNNFATLVDVTDAFRIKGEGTDKNDIINAEYNVKVDGATVADIEVTDFDLNKLEDGYLNGAFSITPAASLLKEMGLGETNATAIAIANPKLEIKVASSDDKASIDVNVINGGKVLFGYTVTSEAVKAADDITAPSKNDVVDADNVNEWVESVDFDNLIAALKKTSLPKELIDAIESSLKANER